MLAQVVYGEARGESYDGQVAVAAVVLNRLEDSQFPNTLSGVVFQKNAFTCVNDGQYYMRPNQTAYKAAWKPCRVLTQPMVVCIIGIRKQQPVNGFGPEA